MSTELLGRQPAGHGRRSSRRASQARAALDRARGVSRPDVAPAAGTPASRTLRPPAPAALATRPDRLSRHCTLIVLVALVLGGELGASWSHLATAAPPAAAVAAAPPEAAGPSVIVGPLAIGPIRLGPAAEPLAPAISQPAAVASPYQAVHRLGGDETLGALAERYGVPLETLVWANGLERGDALVAGQMLWVPHVAGIPYTVAKGDTAATVAAQFGVPLEAITGFPANRMGGSLQLTPGSKIFIPGARRALPPEWLQAIGGLEGLSARRAELAGVVRQEQTNIRSGPSTDHPRLAQLEAGRRVALRARNEGWVLAELGAVRGWIRADMLDAPAEAVAALPVSNDFPAPPPRWVWPARGTLTSGFGPRWRSFHNGLDIANRAWTSIVAARSGVVKEAGWCRGYGYCVKISHDGGVETIYGHLIDQPVVSRGDEVSAGELIGHMGSTYDRAGGGYSTGVHLHFTVLVNGRAVNPMRFLP